jgi:PAS domain S-box-containing protein
MHRILAEHEQSRRFQLLVESVTDYAIFILDPDGYVSTWNSGAERIKGYTGSEIIGRHFSVFYPAKDVAAGKCERELDVAVREGRFEDEGWRLRKDGSLLWANVIITTLRDPEGKLLGFAKVTRDLTKRRDHEEERLRLAKMEEGDRRNQEFLVMMGHELRNPLAPMVTALHVIRSREGRNCEREIAVLDRQLAHLTGLVNDLLEGSQSLLNTKPLELRTMEVGDVVTRAIEVSASPREAKNQTLQVDVPKAGLPVHIDGERLVQVFGNLLNNASKFSDPGATIAIAASAEGENVTVSVSDNGLGMSPELLPRVFDLFAQAEQGIDRPHGGLGIGLAVVQRVVHQHGGQVVAESRGLGLGSRFTVRLARGAGTAGVPAPAPLKGTLGGAPCRRILLVDDSADAVEMMGVCLKSLGHVVCTALEGASALEAARAFWPDIVFLDIGLPGQSGYEVARAMRQIGHCAEVPIVALTGYSRDADKELARQAGFSAHIAKPVDPERLGSIIEGLILAARTTGSFTTNAAGLAVSAVADP